MARATVRLLSLALSMVAVHASVCEAQDVQWGLKGGVNSSSVSAVVDYYDWLLCCDPRVPGARIESSRGAGLTAGGFVAFPVHTWFGVQSDVLLSRRRHSVDLRPYEAIQATFTRDNVEISGLAKFEFVAAGANHVYFGGGPVIGFRVGEDTESSDPRLRRGDPETDIYVVQVSPYGAPELLRTAQTSMALIGGWLSRNLLVEVRFTKGLQSIFKNRDGVISGLVSVGAHEPTVRGLFDRFGPFFEAAKSQDVAIVAGFRF